MGDKQAFSAEQEAQIYQRDGGKCAVCGYTSAYGVEIFVCHVIDGEASLANGQLLCENHKDVNYKNLKSFFVDIAGKAKTSGDNKMENFAADILKTYEEHNIDEHIARPKN